MFLVQVLTKVQTVSTVCYQLIEFNDLGACATLRSAYFNDVIGMTQSTYRIKRLVKFAVTKVS